MCQTTRAGWEGMAGGTDAVKPGQSLVRGSISSALNPMCFKILEIGILGAYFALSNFVLCRTYTSHMA